MKEAIERQNYEEKEIKDVSEKIDKLTDTLIEINKELDNLFYHKELLIKQLDKGRQMWKKLGLVYIDEYRKIRKG